MVRFFFIFFIMISFFSCNRKRIEFNDYDSIILNYNQTDFSDFRDVFISIRDKGVVEVTYMLGKSEANLPLYFVKYNTITNTIVDINKEMLKKANVDGYFSNKKIISLIKKTRKLGFKLISVDKSNNVFINPYSVNSPAILLRLNDTVFKEEIYKGYIYKHYQGKWYLRKGVSGK